MSWRVAEYGSISVCTPATTFQLLPANNNFRGPPDQSPAKSDHGDCRSGLTTVTSSSISPPTSTLTNSSTATTDLDAKRVVRACKRGSWSEDGATAKLSLAMSVSGSEKRRGGKQKACST